MPAPASLTLDPGPRPAAPVARHRRLEGIDGLRAAAALWVVLFHVRAFSGAHLPFGPLDMLVRSGSTGVSLFLALSGFCLYLPVAGGRLHRFHAPTFFYRRLRRLMPAYLVALAGALVLLGLAGPLVGLPRPDLAGTAWQLVTHVLMLHVFFPSTFYAVNGAFWSLGLEWQLYLTLPLLVAVAARFGLGWSVALAVAVNVVYRTALAMAGARGMLPADGVLRDAVLPNLLPGRWAEFAYGMVAAELYATGQARRIRPLAAAGALVLLVPAGFLLMRTEFSHLVFGAVFFLVIILVVQGGNPVAGAAAWRPAVLLGTMSYSLYLVHTPLLQLLAQGLHARMHLPPTAVLAALCLALPGVVAVAYGLFMGVERWTLAGPPTTSARGREGSAKATSAIATPGG